MKIKVCVMFGGKSVEHEVSIISALQAIQNLNKEKYEIIPVYMTREGQFFTGDILLEVENYKDPDKLLKQANEVVFHNNGKSTQLIFIDSFRKRKKVLDVAFPIVHGTNVEDGALQGYLRMMQIPFVGPDVLASSIGMEKTVMKMVLDKHGIPVLPWISFEAKIWQKSSKAIINQIEDEMDYPVIVKPSNLGSSIGIRSVSNRKELIDAVDYARKYAIRIIVERKISNLKEINCAILGDRETQQISACERPLSNDEILTFADKYLGDSEQKGMSGSSRELPANIDDELEKQIKSLAKRTFIALDSNGVSRIDLMVDLDNNDVFVNEINTIPGSLAFYLFEAIDKKYSDLLDELINYALKRDRENSNIDFDYKTNILSVKGQRGKKY